MSGELTDRHFFMKGLMGEKGKIIKIEVKGVHIERDCRVAALIKEGIVDEKTYWFAIRCGSHPRICRVEEES